jgi:hypothetical protein
VAGRRGRDQRIADGQDASSDHPRAAGTVLSDDQILALLAASGKDSHASDLWLWLGKKGRLTPSGIYQMIKDRVARSGYLSFTRTSSGTRSRTTG